MARKKWNEKTKSQQKGHITKKIQTCRHLHAAMIPNIRRHRQSAKESKIGN